MTPKEIVIIAIEQRRIPEELSTVIESLIRKGIEDYKAMIRVNVEQVVGLLGMEK